MKRVAMIAVLGFFPGVASGASVQTFDVWMIVTPGCGGTGSASGEKVASVPEFNEHAPDCSSAGSLTTRGEIPTKPRATWDDDIDHALEAARGHWEPESAPALTTDGADLNCVHDSTRPAPLWFRRDRFALELRPVDWGVHIVSDPSYFGSGNVSNSVIEVEISTPIEARVVDSDNEPSPNNMPDYVMLKDAAAASGEWFQAGRSK